ncbi:MAG: RsmE family RNA methyltransferase [Sphaerochaetaceae bacterium]|nr:RsmE family RNA methyltransferase [Sphaerochaetaceae bacterium]
MRVYILPSSFNGEKEITIKGKDFHYLVRVLRLKPHTPFTARAADGTFWTLTIKKIGQMSLTAETKRVEGKAESTTDTLSCYDGIFPPIHMYQGMSKGKKMEMIIKACTELGIHKISPVHSSFCVADITAKKQSRIERYQNIVKEALQQSGSPVMTEVGDLIHIGDLNKEIENPSRLLVFHQVPQKESSSLFSILRRLIDQDPSEKISLLVGPEGGFSDDEVSDLVSHGARPVFLHTNILRTETAAVAAAALTQQYVIDLLSHK